MTSRPTGQLSIRSRRPGLSLHSPRLVRSAMDPSPNRIRNCNRLVNTTLKKHWENAVNFWIADSVTLLEPCRGLELPFFTEGTSCPPAGRGSWRPEALLRLRQAACHPG